MVVDLESVESDWVGLPDALRARSVRTEHSAGPVFSERPEADRMSQGPGQVNTI